MENDILKHRMSVVNNIAKSFGCESSSDLLEKSEDNDIEKAKHQDGDMHPNGKWVWRQSANKGKGDWRAAKISKRGGDSSEEPADEKEEEGTKKQTQVKSFSQKTYNELKDEFVNEFDSNLENFSRHYGLTTEQMTKWVNDKWIESKKIKSSVKNDKEGKK